MYHLHLTLETPAANLALDAALLDVAESGQFDGEVLRLWESAQPCVVLGRSSQATEVRDEACRAAGVPVLRRSSGGGTVALGPGCLMYSLVLDRRRRAELSGIDGAHCLVLGRLVDALAPLAHGVEFIGTSDLAMRDATGQPPRKFSGNSLRVRRRYLLYHGTLLYDFDVSSLATWLGPPTREPDYRQGRSHDKFVTNLPVDRETLVAALTAAWQAREPLPDGVQRQLAAAVAASMCDASR